MRRSRACDDAWDSAFATHGMSVVHGEPDPWLVASVARVRGVRRAVDLGCGTGRHVDFLLAIADEVMLVDRSRHAVRLARAAVIRDDPRVSVMRRDVATWRTMKKFDAVICTDVVSVVPRPARVLRTVARTVRLGGTAFVTVNTVDDPMFPLGAREVHVGALHFRGFEEEELCSLAEAAGLRVVDCTRYSYVEPPHGHRPQEHEHRNLGLTVERR